MTANHVHAIAIRRAFWEIDGGGFSDKLIWVWFVEETVFNLGLLIFV